MAADTPTPLATRQQFLTGPFADLARSYPDDDLDQRMIEATRACENECGRRLASFTMAETHRAEGIDPDEYTDSANLPLDILGAIGRSYASSMSATSLVRRCWLNQYAPMYPEMWTYSDVSTKIVRSYGGSQNINSGQVLYGPAPDTGLLWFQLGLFLPVGSIIEVTYSGGYTTVPADLARACSWMAASVIVQELNPVVQTGHDPDALAHTAKHWLIPYGARCGCEVGRRGHR